MANLGDEFIQTLKSIFPMFSKVHREKKYNNASVQEREDSKDNETEKFVLAKVRKNTLLTYFESIPESANVIEAIKLNRRFIEEAVNALQTQEDDLVWFLVNDDGEAQYDEDMDLIVYKQGDGTILNDEQKDCQKVRVGLLDEKLMIQGANVGNFEWDKTYLFSFGETGELESIRPIGNNFYT